MKRIAIFASGSGSNAENIITYFQKTKKPKWFVFFQTTQMRWF